MRKLIMWELTTLDGFFEGTKSWDIDWHNYTWGEELEQLSTEQLKSVGFLLFGRVTYEGMAGYWSTQKGEIADFMNSLPKIVFSRTLEKVDWSNTRLVKENAEEEVTRLKQEPGKDLFIFGSANLSSTFLQGGLVDEIRMCIVPVVLGSGSPLFKPNASRIKLKLLEARPLKTGGVIVRYAPEKASS
ncbi:MAG: dihydrofolate reductase family protein [Thaumarchaeota archaeon]|nr:dihydrofolate reductase family protein [Nitrososphaerota archaeon]